MIMDSKEFVIWLRGCARDGTLPTLDDIYAVLVGVDIEQDIDHKQREFNFEDNIDVQDVQ
tara:strand:- start:271 stop:450 length:180 start_codon:yes stop_codon:yes gene_type:complete